MMDNKTTSPNEENETFDNHFESIHQQQPEEWPNLEVEVTEFEEYYPPECSDEKIEVTVFEEYYPPEWPNLEVEEYYPPEWPNYAPPKNSK